MAGGGQVAIFDAKSNQPPEQYPLRRTPLNLILARDVDLGRRRWWWAITRRRTPRGWWRRTRSIRNTGRSNWSSPAIPITLAQWIITDDLGNRTTVILDRMELGGDLPPSLFNITTETQKRGL
jgi:hypothetical protein